jgi:hypothetical protein
MKKIFTLLAMALIAMGAQAQTTISLAGLTSNDFTYDAAQYQFNDDNTISYIIGESTWSDLVLTGKDVKFRYKNSSTKSGFFTMKEDCFSVNGKGVEFYVSNVKKNQIVTLTVAARPGEGETVNVPSFSLTNGSLKGDEPVFAAAGDFQEYVVKVKADGDLMIKENACGYWISSIKIEEGSDDEPVVEANEYTVIFDDADNQTTDGFFTFGTTENKHNFNSKYSGKFEGREIKKGLKIEATTLIEFTSTKTATVTIVQSTATNGANGFAFDGETLSMDNTTEPEGTSSRIYVITGVAAGTHNITRGQNSESGLLVVRVSYSGDTTGISNVQTIEIGTDLMYNLAGQKVDATYKGVVLKNGKKLVIK